MTEGSAVSITPERFFDEVVPQLLKSGRREGATGICEIQLFGDRRAAWTVDLNAGTVSRGGSQASHVYVEMPRQDFEALLAEQLDLEQAVRAGRVRYQGELSVLARFAALLTPRPLDS
ncbi:MAG: SCP2 sterol-binding domain-containing protein [Archangiaceae bacterium]|nr:SCP2 sterol-binding domain-containing protein [Archangiaceae bacterium]